MDLNSIMVQQQAAEGASLETAASNSTSTSSDAEYQAILAKLNSGQALSASELSTLKAKNPAKYVQAVRAQTARSELRTQMEQDPGKATQAARKAISEAGRQDPSQLLAAAGNNADAKAVARALDDEYRQFAAKYDQVDISAPSLAQPAEEE